MPQFHKILNDWYKQNKRDLPWRSNSMPYYVWVSEIILQQTRVDQGTDYFLRFIEKFPDIKSLADAPEIEALKIWQGLGYYSRARNMHVAARQVMNDFNGLFPETFENIKKLKGIGEYTAAAIASISFGLPYAAIDGNVYRVLSRIFGIATPIDSAKGKKEFSNLAMELIDQQNPGTFNEALMEFGALQCMPRNPGCQTCPFQNQCLALSQAAVTQFPVKTNKTKIRHRFFNYLYLEHEQSIFLEKRVTNDIWQNLYQLPMIESTKGLTLEELLADDQFRSLFDKSDTVIGSLSPEIIHLLSHQKLHVRFLEISVSKLPANHKWIKILPENLSEYPIPKLIDNFLMEKNRNQLVPDKKNNKLFLKKSASSK